MVLAEVYHATPRKTEMETEEERTNGGRLLAPSGEIECGANFTRDTATDSPLGFHSFSGFALSPFIPYEQTNVFFFFYRFR